jgi:transcriptional regulator with XRE-family HTH domain
MLRGMPTRTDRLVDAERSAHQRLEHALAECRQERIRVGVSQRQVADALGYSRQLITLLEAGRLKEVGLIQLSRYAAAIGLDLSVRLYPSSPLLRDVAQVKLLERLRRLIGDEWRWRTEVPVSHDPRDLRAIDAVLARGSARVGIEAITRLVDSQADTRRIVLKQEVSEIRCLILLLADTRHNRAAIEMAGTSLRADFPLRARQVLADLRAGREPSANGLLLA